MADMYTNGFTEYGAQRVFLGGFSLGAPNFSPFGERDQTAWGYGKTDTTSLPTPQPYPTSLTAATETLNIGASDPFDILLDGATALQITGVQFLKADNTPVLEVNVLDVADFIYDGEFTILGGSTIDFGTTVDFYDK
jgi:hypothetical protein